MLILLLTDRVERGEIDSTEFLGDRLDRIFLTGPIGAAGLALAGVGAAFLGGYKMFGGKKGGNGKGDDDVIAETNMTEGTFNVLNQIVLHLSTYLLTDKKIQQLTSQEN